MNDASLSLDTFSLSIDHHDVGQSIATLLPTTKAQAETPQLLQPLLWRHRTLRLRITDSLADERLLAHNVVYFEKVHQLRLVTDCTLG